MDIVERLRWGWPADEILSKDMPRVRKDALEAADTIERLREALEPFAKMAEDINGVPFDAEAFILIVEDARNGVATVADLRRARAALDKRG